MKQAEVPKPQHGHGLRAYFTSRKGKRFYAIDYGYKAWPIGKARPKRVK